MDNENMPLSGIPEELRSQVPQFRRLLLLYEFGMQEVLTKVNILGDEFRLIHDYNPLEHVNARIKSPGSILAKVRSRGFPLTPESLRENISDIAGIRLTCSFESDIYRLRDVLLKQTDLRLIRERDYIQNPKPNGYKSLHLVIEVPVFLTDSVEQVAVEIQLRTIAMDFWASLEHKIYYKFDQEVPTQLTDALRDAALVAASLDKSMEQIHQEVQALAVPKQDDPGKAFDPFLQVLLGGDKPGNVSPNRL